MEIVASHGDIVATSLAKLLPLDSAVNSSICGQMGAKAKEVARVTGYDLIVAPELVAV